MPRTLGHPPQYQWCIKFLGPWQEDVLTLALGLNFSKASVQPLYKNQCVYAAIIFVGPASLQDLAGILSWNLLWIFSVDFLVLS